MKTISFVVPCYNSAAYMAKCIDSLLPCGEDIEIILVDDGSTKDETPALCDEFAAKYPNIVRAIHQKNKGHGGAVNTGLAAAQGLYFKVVDSDDWLDGAAMDTIMTYLREQASALYAENTDVAHLNTQGATDLVIANYVYEKVHENTRTIIDYKNVFPEGREFGWDEVGHFRTSQYLLMHSVIYRTAMLREVGLNLPEHCFYVDNIFVYVPLPKVSTMRYFSVDAYRYYIGREDQSVNESVMLSRIDQQLQITKVMIDSVDLNTVVPPKLSRYMRNYLAMMMCICSVFLRMEPTAQAEAKRADIWGYLKAKDPKTYWSVRRSILNAGTNIPTSAGRAFGLGAYHLAQKIFKFN